jgi:hypothetical protein
MNFYIYGYGLNDRNSILGWTSGFFLFATVTRLFVGPTQSPVQWVPGAISPGVKRPWLEAEHSHPANAEFKNAWSYTSSTPLIRLHSVVFS